MADLTLTKLNNDFYLCVENATPYKIDPYNSYSVRWNSQYKNACWLRSSAFTTGDYDVTKITIKIIDCPRAEYGRPSVGISTTAQSHPEGCVNPDCEWWDYTTTLGSITISGTKYNCYTFTFNVDLKARTNYYLYLFIHGTSTSSNLAWEPLPYPLDGMTRTSQVELTFEQATYNEPIITYDVSLKSGNGISSVDGAGSYNQGSNVSILATPKTGYDFINWTGYNTQTDNPYSFQINENRSYTANAKLKTYTVTYNKGANGTGTNETATKTYGTNLTLLGTTFTRTGYTQTGWSTTDGGSQSYALNATYTTNANLTLYPVWTVNKYTVTYKPGANGKGNETSHEKTYGTALTLKDALFTRDGYSQSGWNTKENGSGTSYKLKASYTSNASLTLYPEWTAETYTVSYNKGADGSGTNMSTTKTHDVALTLEDAIFIRAGYTQIGWSKTDGGTKVYNLGESYTSNEPVTLYPVWSANNYIISYKKGTNGTGAESTDNKTHDINITLKSALFTRTGYIQTGWAIEDSGTKVYDLGANYTSNASVTLYPVWVAIQYQVQYHANGGSGSMNNSIHTYDASKNLTANAYINSGYKFTGWNTKADGTGIAYADKASVNNLSSVQDAIINLYAQWSQSVYTVKFDLNGGSYLSGNYNDMTCERGVTYNLPSGTITYPNKVFLGWSTSSTATTATYTTTFSNLGTVGSTITLYAVWKAKTFKIKYNINNGSATTTTTQSCTATSTSNTFKTLPSGWAKSGYSATGWATSSSATAPEYLFGQAFTGDLNVVDGGTLNLYTVWVKQQPWTRCVGMLNINGTYVYF